MQLHSIKVKFLTMLVSLLTIGFAILVGVGYSFLRQYVPAGQSLAGFLGVMLGISAGVIVISSFIMYAMLGKITNPIDLLAKECEKIICGDLHVQSVAVDRQDEFGVLAKAFQEMQRNLQKFIQEVYTKTEQVASSSEELTASSQQSAMAVTRVAGSIAEISEGVEKQALSSSDASLVASEIANKVTEISDKVANINALTEQTTADVSSGREAIYSAVERMEEINTSSVAVEAAVTELAKGSKEIGNIVTLISNIAGQTNLLALNAAIEAARAGEQGRGFAVVAEEVRKLAEESDQASKRIGTLVISNQAGMEQAVTATQKAGEGIAVGISAVHSADGIFTQIVNVISQLAEEIESISRSIEEMAMGSSVLIQSIQDIDAVSQNSAKEAQEVAGATQEQSASMQEIAAETQQLANLADKLRTTVAQFKIS